MGDPLDLKIDFSKFAYAPEADEREDEKIECGKLTSKSNETQKRKTKATTSTRKKQKIAFLPSFPPKDWEKKYTLIEKLRADCDAKIDKHGAEALPERNQGEKVFRFQVLVALMLSSQTRDEAVATAMKALQQHGLTVDNIHATDVAVVKSLIKSVGFYNNKAQYLKEVAETLICRYSSDIPRSAKEIMKLKGVGPKMAYIVEFIAFNTCSGIGIDTHVHRLLNQLEWTQSKNPEESRKQLESWLPKDRWGEITKLFVGFGQEVQQEKEKILRKALGLGDHSSDSLKLLEQVDLNVWKEAKKYGLLEEVEGLIEAP